MVNNKIKANLTASAHGEQYMSLAAMLANFIFYFFNTTAPWETGDKYTAPNRLSHVGSIRRSTISSISHCEARVHQETPKQNPKQ